LVADLMTAAGKSPEGWQRDGFDLMLSTRADGRWSCYEYAEWVARQMGKGVLGEGRVAYGLLLLDEEITWSAHLYGTALIAYRRIREIFRALGIVHKTSREEVIEIDDVPVKVWNSNDQRGFERLDTGRRITFFARSKGGLRGASPDVNVIDEAFAYTFEQQDAIMPTLIAKPNAQTIYLSSPPLTGDTGEVMYALKKRAEQGDSRRLGYRDWGLAGQLDDIERIDIDDRTLWQATCPGLGRGRVTEETIESMRDSMSRNGFGREVLGLWPRQLVDGRAIDMDAWGAMHDPESRRAGDVAIGVDISPKRDYAAISLYGLRADGLGHGQLVMYAPGTDWIVSKMIEWRDAVKPVGFAMGRATYAYLEADLEKADFRKPTASDEPQYNDLVVLNATETTAAVGQLMDAIKQKTFRHADQRELNASVAGAKVKETENAQVLARKDADADTSPLVSLTDARWLFESRAHLVQDANYDVLESVF